MDFFHKNILVEIFPKSLHNDKFPCLYSHAKASSKSIGMVGFKMERENHPNFLFHQNIPCTKLCVVLELML